MEKIKPWIGSLILLPFVILLSINAGEFIFLLDHFNLLIHEGGHGIFSLFGQFIYTLGGTIMQIILPLLFVYYFLSHRKKFGTQLSLVWLGQNLMNISVYVADAQERNLPLLGGNKVYHDWRFILGKSGLLEYDNQIGMAFYLFGIIFFLIALLAPLFMKKYKEANINLNL
ncbi:MAG: hypothetical protein U5K00_24195 [Melioribacteraceae bacterium]|nr:hypothetical protein [Melioribacteraceae bacterium]